ncbi:MAG: hypothetical protein WC451_05965 [Patescibacteria group bacterium]
MKFLAWFFAVIVFFSSFYVVATINARQLFLTPEKTHFMLDKTNFINQAQSVIKKDLFEAENSELAASASKNISAAFDMINFQSKIDDLVNDFYQSLKNGKNFQLSIDLKDFKSALIDQVAGSSDSELDTSEIASTIPDIWNVEAGKFSGIVKGLAFMYNRYTLILITYAVIVAIFFVFCLLISHKYLKLFFWTFITIGLLIILQRFAWYFINPDTLFASIISQGRSGMGVLISSFVRYFKSESERLLLWESIFTVAPAIIGLIVVSVIPEKVNNVPLTLNKHI